MKANHTIAFVFACLAVMLVEKAAWGQAPVETRGGAVVSVSRPASEAGAAMLKKGGNAVDAAIATAFALAVTWPAAGNIGGGGFMMVYPGSGSPPVCIEYRETAPRAATATLLADYDGNEGHRVVGVPGTVAGLGLAHQRYGKLPWSTLVAPAVELARAGFEINKPLADSLNGARKRGKQYAELQRVLAPPKGKQQWNAGDRWVQPDLARTLEQIAAGGPAAFYRGPLAKLLADEMRTGGGLIDETDLANYRANVRAPIHGTYRGYDIYGPPPPSSGGICLVAMLNVLENFSLPTLRASQSDCPLPWSPEAAHLVVESMRRVYRDRARWLGDSGFTEIPAHLTDKAYAKKLAAEIDRQHATPSASLAGDIELAPESPDTTHFSVIDSAGMAVANTYTLQNSFGSLVVVRGAGYLLNNEMTDFNRRPGYTNWAGAIGTKANLIAPGKRMLSSQSPTLVCRDGKLVLVTGSPGGRTIINTVLCTLINHLDYGLDIQRAVDAPRWHHQWFPDRVQFEGIGDPRYDGLLQTLGKLGHRTAAKATRQGDGHSIAIDAAGVRHLAADKRIDGSGAVAP